MVPIIMGGLSAGLGAASSLYGAHKARSAARRAQRRQRRQDAFEQLLAAAGGHAPTRAQPEEPVPSTDYGAIAARAASDVLAWVAQGQEADQAKWLRQYKENLAKESKRHNLATEQAQDLTAQAAAVRASRQPRTGELTDYQAARILGLVDRESDPAAKALLQLEAARRGAPIESIEGDRELPAAFERRLRRRLGLLDESDPLGLGAAY